MEQVGIGDPEGLNVLALAAGASFLLAGWTLYWLSLNAVGAVLGGGFGLVIAELAIPLAEVSDDAALGIRIGGIVIGLVAGIFIARSFHKVAFFAAGTLLGGIAWYVAIVRLRDAGLAPEWAESSLALAVGTPVAAVVCGLLAMLADRLVIAMATAVAGAVLVMIGVNWQWGTWPVVPLAIVGFLIQASLTSKRRKKDKAEKDDED